MIRNIVFDMGQVLIHWTPKQFTASMHLTEEQENQLILEVFRNTEWIRLDRGSISEEEAAASICQRLPQSLHKNAYELVTGWWKIRRVPMEGMAELIRELKENGYAIYLLSNANLRLRTYFPWIPGSEYFNGIFVSAEHRLLKSEREIYEKFLDAFILKPEECFFIDDNPANVEGAERVGIRGTVFHGDACRLRAELRKAGIECRA